MLDVSEGRYSNDAHDPGGPTMRGVIQREYDAYRRSVGQYARPVREMTDDERLNIYKHQYWDMVHADGLPDGIDYMVFDDAVNTGIHQAVRNVQRTLNALGGKLDVDGALGLITMTALLNVDPEKFVNEYAKQRMGFYRRIPGWRYFSLGWTHRIYGQKGDPGVLANALSIIHHDVKAAA
jgi:lysozyme family protein